MKFNLENLESMRSDALKLREIFNRLQPKLQFIVGTQKETGDATQEKSTAALKKVIEDLSGSPVMFCLVAMTLLQVYNNALIFQLETQIEKLGQAPGVNIPTMENPCKICGGIGHTQGVVDDPGVLQQCLRCDGTGREPSDIAEREIKIIVTAFYSKKVKAWVSGLEANTKVKEVTPNTIIDILQGVVSMLGNNQFMTPRSGGGIVQ